MFSDETLKKYSIVDYSYTENLEATSFDHYKNWVEDGKHGDLTYLSDHRMELRSSVSKVYANAQSALVFLFSYEDVVVTQKEIKNHKDYNGFNIASYALAYGGSDYHITLRQYLEEMADVLKQDHPSLEVHLSLDIHPILERDLAYRSGLGFFGKNSMLISPTEGSYFLIGSLILNKKLNHYSQRDLVVDHCGTCRACIDACPTDAIDNTRRTLVADQCISTFTIEKFKMEAVPPSQMKNASGEIFGCDICQDVCPWNKRRDRLGLLPKVDKGHSLHERIRFFLLRKKIEVLEDLESFSNKAFKREFKGTPFERTGRVGMLKNLLFWLSKSKD